MAHAQWDRSRSIWSRSWWMETTDRAVKTTAITAVGAFGGDWLRLYEMPADTVWRIVLACTLLSILVSIGSAPVGTRGTASLLPVDAREDSPPGR